MTKKDYILIANILKTGIDYIEKTAFFTLYKRFTNELLKENPRFDIDKFEKAIFNNGIGNYKSYSERIK